MRSRDPYFDNAKFLLVTLVVIGHSWTLVPAGPVQSWLYDALYAWHVPAFVLITGYLSRNFSWTRAKLWGLVRTVAVPYVIFEGLLAWYRHTIGGVDFHHLWADPHWPMWYLSALFFWRLATPVFRRIPAPVLVAVVLSLTGGLWAGQIADAARIFGLLPFFVLGLRMRPEHWDLLRRPRLRRAALVTLGVILVAAFFAVGRLSTEWLYYRSRYSIMGAGPLDGIGIRFVVLMIGLAGALAFFTLVPRQQSALSVRGRATLEVYLCHGFVVVTVLYSAFPTWAAAHTVTALAVTTVGAITLSASLAAPMVADRLRALTDPLGRIGSAEGRARVASYRTPAGPLPHPRSTIPVLVGDKISHPAQGEGHQPVAAHADRAER